MPTEKTIKFIDNPAIQGNSDRYITVLVDVKHVIESWRYSLFSFEWLTPDGSIKLCTALSQSEKDKRMKIEELLARNMPLQQSILGIGINENIEIGSARAEFLTLAALGVTKIPVHIPRACESDFKAFHAAP